MIKDGIVKQFLKNEKLHQPLFANIVKASLLLTFIAPSIFINKDQQLKTVFEKLIIAAPAFVCKKSLN